MEFYVSALSATFVCSIKCSFMSDNSKFIDIDNVFISKNPSLYKFIPGFFINYLKKIAHQDELNDAIYRNREKFGADFASAMINEFDAKLEFSGDIERFSRDRYIIAGNHPLGGLDGLALMSIAGRVRKDLRFIVNDLLLNVENLREVFIPVNKHGSNPKAAIKLMDEAYASGMLVLTFPRDYVRGNKTVWFATLSGKKVSSPKPGSIREMLFPCLLKGRIPVFFTGWLTCAKLWE